MEPLRLLLSILPSSLEAFCGILKADEAQLTNKCGQVKLLIAIGSISSPDLKLNSVR